MDATTLDAYLRRIGAERPVRPDLESLRRLSERHVLTVPFENLGYHLGEDVHMDEQVLHKIVQDRRGGGCYELNPAFGHLLTALGYEVEILPGQVHRPGGVLGPMMCHLALRVVLDGEPWLVDVGFGRNSRHPLRLASRDRQADPDGVYQLRDADGGGFDVLLDGLPLYRLDDRPCRIEDFAPTLWWWRTCQESPFLQDVFCSLRTEDGRVTLRGDRLTVLSAGGRTVRTLPDDAAVLDAYATYFGFTLDRVPPGPRTVGTVAGVQVG